MTDSGLFSILDDCLQAANNCIDFDKYQVIALVHDSNRFNYSNIQFQSFPDSKKSWLKRLYYEYFYFNKLSQTINPFIWLSLHDVTPNVKAKKQFVYCHNPTPFFKLAWIDWKFDYKIGLFSLFYKYLYRINIRKNSAVIVQQHQLKKAFEQKFKIENCLVVYPEIIAKKTSESIDFNTNKLHFFYPSFPRSFKNFEYILDAINLLPSEIRHQIQVHLTINKGISKYGDYIFEKAKDFPEINCIGLISRSEIEKYYNGIDALIFPSKMETWGLPLSEIKKYHKTIFASNLDYAKETIGAYEKVSFFDPLKANELANLITEYVSGNIVYQGNSATKNRNELKSWKELFDYMIQ